MRKTKIFCLVLTLLCNAAPAIASITETQITHDVNAATKLTSLPKQVAKGLLKARKDKSPWLDQECSVDFTSTATPICEGGDLSSTKTVVLYGDSHASMWMSAISAIGKKKGFKVRLFAKLACPIVEIPIWSYQLNKSFDECSAWQSKVLVQIQDLKPIAIIATNQWKPVMVDGKKSDFDTPFVWENAFPKALAHLNSLAAKLIVIGNNPSLNQDPVACVSKPKVNLALCSTGRTQADNSRFNKIEQESVMQLNGTYIDTVNWACTSTLCPVVIANKLAYFDQWHFSESFVKYLTPALEKKILLI